MNASLTQFVYFLYKEGMHYDLIVPYGNASNTDEVL